MLIPRFSIRWLLGLTTLSAGISLVLSYALRGQPWAIGMLVGLGSLVVLAALYVAAFGVAWLVWRSMGARHTPPGASPFANLPGGEANPATMIDSPSMTG